MCPKFQNKSSHYLFRGSTQNDRPDGYMFRGGLKYGYIGDKPMKPGGWTLAHPKKPIKNESMLACSYVPFGYRNSEMSKNDI